MTTVIQVQTALDRELELFGMSLGQLKESFRTSPMLGMSGPMALAYGAIETLWDIATWFESKPNPEHGDLVQTARESISMDKYFGRSFAWDHACHEPSEIARILNQSWSGLVELATSICQMADEKERRAVRALVRDSYDGTD